MNPLEAEFEQRLYDAIRESISLGYSPARIETMLKNYGGVKLAKRLVVSGEIQSGIKTIKAMGHPELSIESIMLEPKFSSLFSEGERAAAQWRLDNA
jgi:hypothetical protein